MAFVLDASLALSWFFEDEKTAATELLLERASLLEPIFVPMHWPLEILHALFRASRRGRVEDSETGDFLRILSSLAIASDQRSMNALWEMTIPLMERYAMSAYDAAYLALALEHSVPLATNDQRLRTAAVIEGCALLGE